jgi:hypothetical protein
MKLRWVVLMLVIVGLVPVVAMASEPPTSRTPT